MSKSVSREWIKYKSSSSLDFKQLKYKSGGEYIRYLTFCIINNVNRYNESRCNILHIECEVWLTYIFISIIRIDLLDEAYFEGSSEISDRILQLQKSAPGIEILNVVASNFYEAFGLHLSLPSSYDMDKLRLSIYGDDNFSKQVLYFSSDCS